MKKIIIGIIVCVAFYCLLYWLNASYMDDYGIPVVKISLKNVSLEDIHTHDKSEKYYDNVIQIFDHHKKVFHSTIMIKGRGNQTWTLDKKPYQIAFDEKVSILGLPDSKKYVLLANANDSSLLKNDFSYRVAKNMNLNYSFSGVYIDLYIDDIYLGNYYMTPKIDINSATVDIKNDHAVLMELDNTYYMYEKEEEVFETNYFHDHIVLKDNNSDSVFEDIHSFQSKYNEMELAIMYQDYDTLKEIVDLESFAKYYIISEFSENSDSIHSSLFFYMDGYDDLIHIGPLWDFDITYGQRLEYSDCNQMPIMNYSFPEGEGYSVLFYYLLQMDEFRELVSEVWDQVARDVYLEEIQHLDTTISYIQTSAIHNNKKWNMVSYPASTVRLKEWIQERYQYFDSYMGVLYEENH